MSLHCLLMTRLTLLANGIALDTFTGHMYTLSSSAVKILSWMYEGHSTKDIVERISNEFGIEMHRARRDVDSFLASLKEYNLV